MIFTAKYFAATQMNISRFAIPTNTLHIIRAKFPEVVFEQIDAGNGKLLVSAEYKKKSDLYDIHLMVVHLNKNYTNNLQPKGHSSI